MVIPNSYLQFDLDQCCEAAKKEVFQGWTNIKNFKNNNNCNIDCN